MAIENNITETKVQLDTVVLSKKRYDMTSVRVHCLWRSRYRNVGLFIIGL